MSGRYPIVKVDKIFRIDKFGSKTVWRKRVYLQCGHSQLRMPSTREGNSVGAYAICKVCKFRFRGGFRGDLPTNI